MDGHMDGLTDAQNHRCTEGGPKDRKTKTIYLSTYFVRRGYNTQMNYLANEQINY